MCSTFRVTTQDSTLPRLRTLMSFLAPHKSVMLLGLVLGLLGNAAGLAAPMVTKRIIDTLGTTSSLRWPIVALFALVIVGAAISLWQWILLGTLAQRVVLDARTSIIRHYFAACCTRPRPASSGWSTAAWPSSPPWC